APGRVTRLAGDPIYDANPAANPGADDDYYFAGEFPPGFNGLAETLFVPADEPWSAWERAHSHTDLANRLHLVLTPAQVAAAAGFRLRVEFATGGTLINGVSQPGFGPHDMEIQFRNGAGTATVLRTQTVTQATEMVLEFTAGDVGATPGANTLEITRTGPRGAGIAAWLLYDYLRLEALSPNAAPTLTPPGDRQVDELALLNFSLQATDPDPQQTLSFALVDGPAGMTVTTAGLLSWIPTEAQGPGVYTVTVRVTDNGAPAASDTRQFTVTVAEVPDPVARTVWQIGTDNLPSVAPYAPSGEFSIESGRNDAAPGLVTRLPGDPQYAAGANPVADDDFYFAGAYPAGFNGLAATLSVPNDEPPAAWERAHSHTDLANRLHFLLAPEQVGSGKAFRLRMEFTSGGTVIGGVTQPGIGLHDMEVRFRNGSGVVTPLLAQRVTQIGELAVDFTAASVTASAGANSIEVVRTGPVGAGITGWILYDYLRLESLDAVNTPPVLTAPGDRTMDELTPLALQLQASDADLPAQALSYALVSGPPGLQVNAAGALIWTPTEAQGPGVYTVSVRVTDAGIPALSDTRQFTVTVNEVPDPAARTIWQIGTDEPSTATPHAEFSAENGRNDAPPGLVTRIPGDPQYVAAGNPGADDDFYFAGAYPAGFNGLMAPLLVPNDEPSAAWERAHTHADLTNRIHFVLTPEQAASGTSYRLRLDLPRGSSAINGVTQPGIGVHDMAVRFRNGSGVLTTLATRQLTQPSDLVVEFTAGMVGATAGPNSIEVVRTGPLGAGITGFILYDFLRLEALGVSSNTPPTLAAIADRALDELTPLAIGLQATDADVPAQSLSFALVSGPPGLQVTGAGALTWTPTEAQGPGVYTVTVQVTDSGIPALSATRQFTVTVNE
ncbi:MAG: cadherin repeat domain-containing protein, partial [Verrucomicrobia bacterium]|nr:cadherin repeat domain-containing protein [Verrucomicrobiota bacterium]